MIKFRPQDLPKKHILKERRMGLWVNYNFQSRNKWYPAGWKPNHISIGRRFSHLHYLSCHSPLPIQKKWRRAYKQFCNQHFADKGNASMRFLNNYTAHRWL